MSITVLSLDELKEQIRALPDKLREALERQAKATMTVAHLETRMDRLQAEIDSERGEIEEENAVNRDFENDLELLKLESTAKHLKLEVAEAENKAEIEIRRSSGRVTEGHVKAAVGTDSDVSRLKHALLDAEDAAKVRKVTLQRERRLAREAALEARSSRQPVAELLNPRMSALQSELEQAREEVLLAALEVEVVRTTVGTYKLLVQLEGVEVR